MIFHNLCLKFTFVSSEMLEESFHQSPELLSFFIAKSIFYKINRQFLLFWVFQICLKSTQQLNNHPFSKVDILNKFHSGSKFHQKLTVFQFYFRPPPPIFEF